MEQNSEVLDQGWWNMGLDFGEFTDMGVLSEKVELAMTPVCV